MHKNTNHRPTLYVCLISDFTIANAQAILQFKPEEVIAISTPEMKSKAKGVEQRFERFLKSTQCIYRIWGSSDDSQESNTPPYAPFQAASAHETRRWIEDYLRPELERKRQAGYILIANITGGTKVASIALHNGFKWDDIHYTAEAARGLLETAQNESPTTLCSLPLSTEVHLLNDTIREVEDPWNDKDIDSLLKCANIMHNDYLAPAKSKMLKSDKMLRDLWYNNMTPDKIQECHTVTLLNGRWYLPTSEIATFLSGFADLHPDIKTEDNGGIILPASKEHPWVRFIAGIWWEHLVAAWAAPLCREVQSNVVIDRELSTDNESDILVRTQNNELRVIECKVEPPNAKGLKEIYNKLASSVPRFGKTKAALMLSPVFFNRISNEDAKTNFLDACAFRGIKILQSKSDLENWLTDKRS